MDIIYFDMAEFSDSSLSIQRENERKIQTIYLFLHIRKWLSHKGEEIYKYGLYKNIPLDSSMLNPTGNEFLRTYYDNIVYCNSKTLYGILSKLSKEFVSESYYDHEIICKILNE